MDDHRLYREYLQRQQQLDDADGLATGALNASQTVVAVARYMGVRAALHGLVYPLDSAVLLMQLMQADISPTTTNTTNTDTTHGCSPLSDKTSVVSSYEEYLLRPAVFLHGSATDPNGNLTERIRQEQRLNPAPTGPPEQYPVELAPQVLRPPRAMSVLAVVKAVVRHDGLFSLWQGYSAHYWSLILGDAWRAIVSELSSLLAPRLVRLFSGDLLRESGAHGSSSPESDAWLGHVEHVDMATQVALNAVGAALLLQPLEVAKVHMALASQASYRTAQRVCGIRGVLGRLVPRWHPCPILAGVSAGWREASALLPPLVLDFVASRYLREQGIAAQLALVLGDFALRSLALVVALPLETLRVRMIAADVPADMYDRRIATDLPPPPQSASLVGILRTTVREEGWRALYRGWGLRVTQTAVQLASQLLLHWSDQQMLTPEADDF